MTRPVLKLMLLAVYFTVMTQVHCSENNGTVVDMIDDLSKEVIQVKEDLLGIEAKTLEKINLAKISLKSRLIQDIKQLVRDAIAEILQGESIEEMVRSQVVSEVRELKRGRHHMKVQLRHVLDTVRDLKEEREANKGVSMNQNDGSELKCNIVEQSVTNLSRALQSNMQELELVKVSLNTTTQNVSNTKSKLKEVEALLRQELQSAKSNISRFEESVTNLSRALQSNKEELELVKVCLNTTKQNLSNTKSKLKEVEALLGQELQMKNSELTKVQASVNATVQDLMRTKSKLEIVQASLSEQGEDLLNTNSELVTAVSTISAMKDKQRDNISRLRALEKKTLEVLNKTNKISPVVYFKAERFFVGTRKFDHVLANIGNGYNSESGVFSAPVSGIYLVNLFLGTSIGRKFRNPNRENTEAYVAVKTNHDTASTTTMIYAKKGDRVFVVLELYYKSTQQSLVKFSCFLLRAD